MAAKRTVQIKVLGNGGFAANPRDVVRTKSAHDIIKNALKHKIHKNRE